jgi:N-acetylmuramoyl-L-alanine amidase
MFFAGEVLSAETKSSLPAIKNIEFTHDGKIKVIISQKTSFKVFTLEAPNRVVIDVENAVIDNPEQRIVLPNFVEKFRYTNKDTQLRLVFELNRKLFIKKTRFEKIAKKTNGSILIELVDAQKFPTIEKSKIARLADFSDMLKPSAAQQKAAQATVSAAQNAIQNNFGQFVEEKIEEFEIKTKEVQNEDGSKKFVMTKTPVSKTPTIIIDSGHGGKDPGTISSRSQEKDITLAYAKELGRQLVKTGKYRVFLTRDSDFFIPLRQRVEIARKKKADLFISLHVNASPDKSAEGFSIYTLSENSSDKQAEMLAQKENRADIINGMDFSTTSKDIVSTLIDMSQRDSKNKSSIFANRVIRSVQNHDINILQNTHRFAGFAVLTAPDMASVLVELGYLSNKSEEKLLNNIDYKKRVAASMVEAIGDYFSSNKI